MSLLAIPPALFFLVPPFASYVLAAHPTSSLARLAIAALAFLAIPAAVLGLAFAVTWRLPLYQAATIFVTLLKCTLGVCVIHLINIALPHRFSKFYLYNIVFVIILSCATLTSLVAPFFASSSLCLLAAVLTLVSSVLPFLPLILLLFRLGKPNSSPLPSEKSFQVTRGDPLSPCLRASHEEQSPSLSLDQPEDPCGTLYPFLICAQIAAVLTSALGLSVRTRQLGGDIEISTAVVEIIESVVTVVWTYCMMAALLVYPHPAVNATPSSYFTPQPSRIIQSRSPQTRPYYLCPTRTLHPLTIVSAGLQIPTPTPSHLTEDFLNLRDPFAPPNAGVTVGTAPGVTFSPGIGTVANIAAAHSPPRSKSRARLKSRTSSASQVTRRSRRRPSVSTRTSAPASTLSMRSADPGEDIDFDPEEALLTQLLLRNLDTGASGPPQSAARFHSRPHRFTQDSTSTGQTLCECDAFRLPRGSLSTEASSACVSLCAELGSSAEQSESPVRVKA